MMKLGDNKIGTREFTAIILIAIGMKVTDTTPSLLFEKGENAAWALPIFFLVTVGIPFLIVLSLVKKHQKGLVDLIFQLTGKFFGSLFCFIFFLLLFSSITFNFRSSTAITSTLFYAKTSIVLLSFLALFTVFLVAKRGFTAIGSGAWLIIPTLEITLLFLLFGIYEDIDWLRIFPLGGPGLGTLVKESVLHSSLFGEIILLSAFFPFIRSYENYQLASLLGFGIAVLKMSLFLAIYVMVFDYPSAVLMAYPHQELTRIAEFGTSITHIEGVFFIFWLIASVFRYAIYIYLSAFFLGGALRLEKFEKLLLPIVGLVLLTSLLPANIFTMNPYRGILMKISSWILIVFPFILWALSKFRGGEKNQAPKNSPC